MPSQDFFILLPPSEGKAIGGNNRAPWDPNAGVFGPALGDFRHDVAGRLAELRGGNAQLLGVKGDHLNRAQAANSSLIGAATLPAWQRYTGVVWDHLDVASLPASTRNKVVRRIFVPSGLMGIVRADDDVPDYRLKMGARLAPFGLMSTWWRDDLTDAFSAVAKKKTIVDLLPQEHRAALSRDRLRDVRQVDLVSRTGGIVGGHNAKAAKGLLARHLLCSGESFENAVESFDHPEYSAVLSN